MTSTEIQTNPILLPIETARGTLRDGECIKTMVDAVEYVDHAFTATRVTQGRINAMAYNAPNGAGSHVGVTAHGVVSVEVSDNATDTGLTLRIMTESGQALTVDLFGARVDGGYQPITLVVAAESTVTA